jgi:nucleoside-diphosphate-sugar epimerase
MRIFVAGAAGAIGRRLVPALLSAGHQVIGMTRSAPRADEIRAMGAEPVVSDALNPAALSAALNEARPQVVINQLTAIPPRLNPRQIMAGMAATNRLRGEGTSNLVKAARDAGARRVISQSIAFAYAPAAGSAVEEDPLFDDAPLAYRPLVDAVEACERSTISTPGIEGIVLRYGYFYGPGTVYARDGTFASDVLHRRIPILGSGAGVFSFIHLDDAAAATVLALNAAAPRVYNIVDDEPVRFGEWLPSYAALLHAPRPRRVPAFLGRLAAGPYGMYLLTQQRGASNRSARTRLGWTPRFASWRDGFRAELAR